jgi:hypothetical protein
LHTFGYNVKVANREGRPSDDLVDSPNTSSRLHPFDVSAINVAGPYYIKIGRSMVKCWLLVI